MNRIFLLLIFFLSVTCSFGQNIPNGDFENWGVKDHYKLDSWYTVNNTVYRTTDAKVGQYAIRLNNTLAGKNGLSGFATNYRRDNRTMFGGAPFKSEPLSLVYWSKHDLALGDTARILVELRDKGRTRGKVDFRFSGSTNGEFVKYSIPIQWNGIRNPDTVRVSLFSKQSGKVQGEGYVIYDDIHFENLGTRSPDIINANLENWGNIGLDTLDGWKSVDLRHYEDNRNFYDQRSVFKSSAEEAFLGNHSLIIKNYVSGSRARTGFCYLGTEKNHILKPAFPFTDTFRYVQGYYKYLPEREDTARILVRTYAESNTRSSDIFYLTKADTWTFFSFPLSYNDIRIPDSASFAAYSSIAKDTLGNGTMLFLDNLDLVLEPTPLTLSTKKVTQSVKTYPNPTKDFIYLPVNDNFKYATIADMFGRVRTTDIQHHRLDLREDFAGIYFITLYGDQIQSKTIKVIKSEN